MTALLATLQNDKLQKILAADLPAWSVGAMSYFISGGWLGGILAILAIILFIWRIADIIMSTWLKYLEGREKLLSNQKTKLQIEILSAEETLKKLQQQKQEIDIQHSQKFNDAPTEKKEPLDCGVPKKKEKSSKEYNTLATVTKYQYPT